MRNVLVTVAAISAILAASASEATAAVAGYRFVPCAKASDETLTVRLEDEATGQPVKSAHVFAIHRQWLPVKGVPRFIDRHVALEPEASGGFTYKSRDVQTGATIRVVAQVDGSDSEIPGRVHVCGCS